LGENEVEESKTKEKGESNERADTLVRGSGGGNGGKTGQKKQDGPSHV